MARELILDAAADLIVEHGLEELSLGDVAARAGVSKRTFYNYFDGRDTLFAELRARSDELTIAHGAVTAPSGLDNLSELIPALWRTWAATGNIHRAVTMIEAASPPSGAPTGRRKRRQAIADGIVSARPDLTADEAFDLAAVLHAFVSGPVFDRLTVEDGVDVERASRLVAWAIGLMRDAIENETTKPFGTQEEST